MKLPEVPQFDHYLHSMAWFRAQDSAVLNAMWHSDDYEMHCDEIYTVMHERGLGDQVAI